MKIYDCCLYMNEHELFDLRYNTLKDVVDYFVVVESNHTFNGNVKGFNFNNYINNYDTNNIIYIQIENLDTLITNQTSVNDRNCWTIQYAQRNYIMAGLVNAKPDDRIMISDIDEIPHPLAVLQGAVLNTRVGFKHTFYYYYINCKQDDRWYGTVMDTYSNFNKNTPQEMRDMRCNPPGGFMTNIGWHFSLLGGVDRILYKLNSFNENNIITDQIKSVENINKCMMSGEDLFHRHVHNIEKYVLLDKTYPDYIQQFILKYPYTYKQL